MQFKEGLLNALYLKLRCSGEMKIKNPSHIYHRNLSSVRSIKLILMSLSSLQLQVTVIIQFLIPVKPRPPTIASDATPAAAIQWVDADSGRQRRQAPAAPSRRQQRRRY